MPSFSDKSASRLATCHPDLRAVLEEVIKYRDCTIIEGVRTVEQQTEYVRTGKSRTMASKHLVQPDGWSHAVDVAPWPIDWEDHNRFSFFAGYVAAVADAMLVAGTIGHRIRWGGDWDSDGNIREHSFSDKPHFELVP